MIQRIQTIYLLIALLISAFLPFEFYLQTLNDYTYTILFGLNTSFTLVSIMYFKKRQHQFVLNRLSIILNLILLGLFLYSSLNLSRETLVVSEKGIGMFLPIFAIVFLALANKSIKKDEDLVKSADRLR
ncbi:MAG: DUF4293 family protein [Flavobacteriaceae bacterium]|nr:DUF4293 family protein [Flavobacteriaceae bacterium]